MGVRTETITRANLVKRLVERFPISTPEFVTQATAWANGLTVGVLEHLVDKSTTIPELLKIYRAMGRSRLDAHRNPEETQRYQQEVARIQAQRLRDRFFFQNPQIRDCESHWKALVSRAETLTSDDGLITFEILEEAAKLLVSEGGIKVQKILTETEKKARAAKDLETFKQAAIEFGFADNAASQKLIAEVLGSGYTVYDIGQAINSNTISLAPVGEAEQRKRDEQERNNLVDELIEDQSHPWTQETGMDPRFYAEKQSEIQQFQRAKFEGYTTQQLRDAVSNIRERRKFGQMTPTEIRKHLRETRQAPGQDTELNDTSGANILLSMQAAGEDRVKAAGREDTRAAGEADYLRRLCRLHGWQAIEQKLGRVEPHISGIVRSLRHEFDRN
jgi:hypothetical protein